MAGNGKLDGHRVMVVEDDWFIASYVAGALEQAGAEVLGPLPSAAEALRALDEDDTLPGAATLNVTLADGNSLPVAGRLAELDVPFLFLSAVAAVALPPELLNRPRLEKPFAAFQVVDAVRAMLERPGLEPRG